MKVELDDLVDSTEVAQLLGLSSQTAVSTYRNRYDDFPAPVLTKASGKCVLWHRPQVEAWVAEHPRRARIGHRAAPTTIGRT